MHELRCISLMHWNLVELEDIPTFGVTALIGTMGAGKSSILDAIQTVQTGNQVSKLSLNRAASTVKSTRSVKEYCLGVTEDTIRLKQVREACHSMIVLSYRDDEIGSECSVGVVLYADRDQPREETVCRFIAEGTMFSFEEFADRDENGSLMIENPDIILDRLREKAGRGYSTHNQSAAAFIENYLRAMRPRRQTPNANDYIRRFRNAIAFREIDDPTKFIRGFVLDDDPIQTDRLRTNLETWDEISGSLENLKKKIADARRIQTRFSTHAEYLFDRQETKYQTAWNNGRIARLKADAESEKLRQASLDLTALAQKREAVNQDIARQERLLEEKRDRERTFGYSESRALIQERISSKESSLGASVGALNSILQFAGGLRYTGDLNRFLPPYAKAAKADAEQLEEIRRSFSGAKSLPDAAAEIIPALSRIKDAGRAKESLRAQLNAHVVDLSQKEEERSEKTRQLRSRKREGAVLKPQTQAFIELLIEEGITAEALPMIVDIEPGMEDWVRAAEIRLGAFKEAIYVDPKNFNEAFRILRERKQATSRGYDREHRFHDVRLINTPRIAEGKGIRSAAKNAVISILKTENDIVRSFLDSQFGGTVMVDSLDELKVHSDAIMKDGSQSQGLAVRVNRMSPPILGRVAQENITQDLRARIEELQAEIPRQEAFIEKLRLGEKLFDKLSEIDTEKTARLIEEIRGSLEVLCELRAERDAEVTDEERSLLADIETHKANIEKLKAQLTGELEDENRKLIEKQTRAKERSEEQTKRTQSYRDVCKSIEDDDRGPTNTRWRNALRHMEHQARGRTITALKGRLEQISDRDETWHMEDLLRLAQKQKELEAQAEREGRNIRGIAGYLNEYGEDIKISEYTPEDVLNWLVTHVLDMEDNELLKYQAQINEFQERTRTEVREVLMNKLNDRLQTALSELKKLNKRIKRHKFEGMTYVFDWKIDPTMRPLYQMARRVAEEADRAEVLLTEGGEPLLNEAVDIIRDIFRNEEGAAKFEDYRQYFVFELIMTRDEVTDVDIESQGVDGLGSNIAVTGNLTDRIGKGSGGQKQTPYYVAIAASMAAAYYPNARPGESVGMGLVCFDEAFNKLDIRSTQELIRLYKDLNLQILIAAPEEKRTSFMEVSDTIINISKTPGAADLFIDVEHIGDRAKQELRNANPEHIGFEGFSRQFEEEQVDRPKTEAAE